MRRILSVTGLVALAMAAACDNDVGIAGPGEPFRFGSPGTSTVINSVVVGTWLRSVTFVDETGIPRSSETTWAFNADGTALRSIITRNLAAGTASRQDAFGNWQIIGNEIVVDFLAPFTSRVRLAFVRDGDQLSLAGQTFIRTL